MSMPLLAGCLIATTLAADVRERICLNGDWLVHLGGDEWNIPEKGYALFRVPGKIGGDWASEFNRNDQGHECGWYRLQFAVPADWPARRVGLEFTRVGCYAKIFLDGRLAGEHADGNVPFRVDLTGLACPGRTHRLEVFVQGWSRFQGESREGVWPIGSGKQTGILSDVFLTSLPEMVLDDVFVMTSVQDKMLIARVWVWDSGSQDLSGAGEDPGLTVRTMPGSSRAFSSRGRTVCTIEGTVYLGAEKVLDLAPAHVDISPGQGQMVEFRQRWENPKLWGFAPYGEPVLYHLALRLKDARGADLDRSFTRFGFREFRISGDRFLLNGKPIFLQGEQAQFSMHCLYPHNRQWLLQYFRALRAANVNFVRLPHGVFFPIWAEVADEVGMLLENEPMDGVPTPAWASDLAGGQQVLGEKADARGLDDRRQKAHFQTIRGWVQEWRNHPSLVMWSTDNESCTQGAAAEPANLLLLKRIKELILSMDPTRPVDHEGSPMASAAKRLGVDLVPDVFNAHPYSDPITGDVEKFKERYFYSGQPVLIGELFNDYAQINFLPNQLRENPADTWAKTERFADYWYRNILAARKAGYAGTVILSIATSCFHGFVTADQRMAGPFGRAKPLVPVTWPALSGREPKVDNVPDSIPWDSINWFDETKPIYLENHVFKRVRQAYREANGGDLAPLPATRSPELIVELACQGKPVEDAYLYLVPAAGQPVSTEAVRTDNQGRAWFHGEVPGRYQLEFRQGKTIEKLPVELKPMALDGKPGYGHIPRLAMALKQPPDPVAFIVADGVPNAEPDVVWQCLPVGDGRTSEKPKTRPDSPEFINLSAAIDGEGKLSPKARECSLHVYLKDADVTASLRQWGGSVSLYPEVSKSSAFVLTMPAPRPGKYELILHDSLLGQEYPARMFIGDEKKPRMVLDTNAADLGLKFSLADHDARTVIALSPENLKDGRVKLRFEAATWGTAIIRGITLRPLD